MREYQRRDRLRAGTGEAHALLDARFLDGVRCAAHYRAYVLGMQAFVANAERALAGLEPGPCWRAWCVPARTAWLDEDLVALALPPLAPGPPLVVGSDAEAAGLVYVIEGSALGARQLLADARDLGFGPASGAAFLGRHAGAAERWRAFVSDLEAADFGPADERALLESAARAFASVEQEFHRAERALAIRPGLDRTPHE
jgi:heme oxygenase